LNIFDPSYPDPGSFGMTPPTNRYLLSDGLVLPENLSLNAGVDRQLSSALRVSATYTHRRGTRALRGRNLNAPVAGVRPDAQFSNVVEVLDDAEARTNMLGVHASFVKLNWRQTFFSANYTLMSSRSNTTGAFSLPQSAEDLAAEWGQAAPLHRVSGSFSMQPIRNLGVSVNASGQSGAPYNITTGFDTNGDGVFNDRPSGTGRNTARAAAQWDLGMRVSYAIGFGTRPASGGGGGGGTMVVMGSPGAMGGFGGGANDKRFRVEFYASAQNVTNRRNYIGYSGVQSSPFYLQPTNVRNPRKVELGMRFGF